MRATVLTSVQLFPNRLYDITIFLFIFFYNNWSKKVMTARDDNLIHYGNIITNYR